MIIRLVKLAILGTAAYYAGRRVAAHTKLLGIRAEAQAEMDRLEGILRVMHSEQNQFDLTDPVKKITFDDTLKQLSKWTRIHARTF